MLAFLLKRLLWMAATLWVVFTVTFFLMRFVPGGPFASEKQVPPAIRRNIEAHFKMDRPLYEQYFSHLISTAFFDLGPSYRLADYTVNEVIAQGFPVSASLGIFA